MIFFVFPFLLKKGYLKLQEKQREINIRNKCTGTSLIKSLVNSVVKNPPSNAEDIGSILVKELRFHTPWEIRLSTTRQGYHYNKTPLGSGVSGELLNSLNKQ